MKMILVLNLIGSLIHQSEAYKPVVVIHGLKEKVSDLDFLKDNITKVFIKMNLTRFMLSPPTVHFHLRPSTFTVDRKRLPLTLPCHLRSSTIG